MSRRTRRKRRQAKAALRFGRSAKPTHKLKAGRTGLVGHKRTPDRQDRDRIVTSEPWSVPESVRLAALNPRRKP